LHEAKTALADRKVIERAKGILMEAKSLNEQEAYVLMRKTAMDQKRRLVEIARAIVMAESMLK
jgi:two-component system, response regulator / RNA-binding antiterminator